MKIIQVYELKSESNGNARIKYFLDRGKAAKAYYWEGVDALEDQLLAARYGGEQYAVDVTLSAIELRAPDEYAPTTDKEIKIDGLEEISRKTIKSERVG